MTLSPFPAVGWAGAWSSCRRAHGGLEKADPVFLAEAGWDPETGVLTIDPAHPLLGRTLDAYGSQIIPALVR